MTVFHDMKARAIEEFDRLVAEEELRIRCELAKLGRSAAEIERGLDACRPGLAAQRAEIGKIVTVSLLAAGVPCEAELPK